MPDPQNTQTVDDPWAVVSQTPVSSTSPASAPEDNPWAVVSQAPMQKEIAPEDQGVIAGVKRNTVGLVKGLYHALSDPATEQEKSDILNKIQAENKKYNEAIPEELANNPSRATLAYHRLIDAPAVMLADKGHDERQAAHDLMQKGQHWAGANAYLSGLTDTGLSAVPVLGPMINNIAERWEAGDHSGAATDITMLLALEHAPKAASSVVGKILGAKPELLPEPTVGIQEAQPTLPQKAGQAVGKTVLGPVGEQSGKLAERATGKQADAIKTQALQNMRKAIPPSKSTPYEDADLQTARNILEEHHSVEGQEIRNVQDIRDASDVEIKERENRIGQAVGKIANDPITTNVLKDVERELNKNTKIGFADEGLKALKEYNLENPTIAEADRIRRDLNNRNRATLQKNKYDVASAQADDPGFAARQVAADSLREGIYGQLEARGFDGVDELRKDEGSLIRIRNAAERQIYAGDKTVRGSGKANTARRIAGGVAKLAATGAGSAIAGPAGSIAGSVLGDILSNAIAPGDLTRDALIEKSFGMKATSGNPAEITGGLKEPEWDLTKPVPEEK
jgi:hypothetical protein